MTVRGSRYGRILVAEGTMRDTAGREVEDVWDLGTARLRDQMLWM